MTASVTAELTRTCTVAGDRWMTVSVTAEVTRTCAVAGDRDDGFRHG